MNKSNIKNIITNKNKKMDLFTFEQNLQWDPNKVLV